MVTPGLVSESLGTYITQMYSQIGPNGPQTRIQHHAHLRGVNSQNKGAGIFLDKSASRSIFFVFFFLITPLGEYEEPGGGTPGRARACSGAQRPKTKGGAIQSVHWF